jgi:hypothetical protein
MGKLIIHIGPPKTATTSLQYFFMKLDLPDVYYGGIIQPRTEEHDSICELIYEDIQSNQFNFFEKVHEQIKQLFSNYEYILLSEEMFLVESEQISWRHKLKNLINYLSKEIHLEDLSFVIIVRNPAEAIPSYFQEIYWKLPKKYQKNYLQFLDSEYSYIYKYYELWKFIKEQGVNNIKIILFEDLISKKITFSQISGCDIEYHRFNILLPKLNVSGKINSNKRIIRPVSLRELVTKKIMQINKHRFLKPLRNKGIGDFIIKLIPKIKFAGQEVVFEYNESIYNSFLKEYDKIKTLINENKK